MKSYSAEGAITGANSRVAQAVETTGAKFHVVELWAFRLINPNCKQRMYLVVKFKMNGPSDSKVPMGFANKAFPVIYLSNGIFYNRRL